MAGILDHINDYNDIKKVEQEDYPILAKEIRKFLIKGISRTGGHLASNLGVVELTMAIHLCMDFPEDKVVWDVGHQTYTHKILTGRKDQFATLRHYEGMSGFPKRNENECDAFDTGHSSTAISVALGLAHGRDIQGKNHKVISVLGDGSLSGGMAYEALNNAARLKSNMIIILNDNSMSISENVGGMANYLGNIRTDSKYLDLKGGVENVLHKVPKVGEPLIGTIRSAKDSIKRFFVPGMLFEDMGLTYLGPIDGHNIPWMVQTIQNAMRMKEAVIIHVNTKKGRGYRPAENNPSAFHGVEPFHIRTGAEKSPEWQKTYTQIFSETMLRLGEEKKELTAVSAAMPSGTGLAKFAKKFPKRFFDVGIAEEHAVTFAAGMASAGMKPVVAIYSTFLQRAYDQILHDVCIGRFPVIFAIDRAGIVGCDGETHQGVFDITFMNSMPDMTVIAPKNGTEFEKMLKFCVEFKGPIAIRYPRGHAFMGFPDIQEEIVYGKAEILISEKDILLLAVGSMVETAQEVYCKLKEAGHSVSLINARFIKPFDEKLLLELVQTHKLVVTLEENIYTGGFGQQVASFLHQNAEKDVQALGIALPETFIEHGTPEILKEKYGIDADTITEKILMSMLF